MSWSSHRRTKAICTDPARKGKLLIALIPLRRDAWERCPSGGRVTLISVAGIRRAAPLVRYTTSPLPDPKPNTATLILLKECRFIKTHTSYNITNTERAFTVLFMGGSCRIISAEVW